MGCWLVIPQKGTWKDAFFNPQKSLASTSHPVFSGERVPNENHLAKGMNIRMGTSDLRRGLCGNPPTVLRSHKTLDIYSQNQMMRWAL